jgi:hypothetical protein
MNLNWISILVVGGLLFHISTDVAFSSIFYTGDCNAELLHYNY